MIAKETIRNVGLVGVGRWGKNLARNLNDLEVLHTICDTNESTHDTFQEQFPKVHMTTNFKTILENPLITSLFIAAPAIQHYTLAKQALLENKDVYVEKPLCLETSEAKELIKLAKDRGLILMVGHLLQYHPCIVKVQELVRNGVLGQLQYIASHRLSRGPIRSEENALWNFAPHDVSVILSLCADKLPQMVQSTGGDYTTKNVADISMTNMRFEGGTRAHIFVSWLHPFKEQKLVVVGSSGSIVFDDTKPWEEKLTLTHNAISWLPGNIPHLNSSDAMKVEVPQDEPLKAECLHFLECCEKRITPKTDGQEGLRVQQVLQAAQSSMDDNGAAKNPAQQTDTFAHPTAVIDRGCQIGAGTKIWHFSHVMERAKIGERCNIGQNVVVSPEVVLGNNVKVQNNVTLYTGVVCENDVFLGPSMVFTNIINPRSEVGRRDKYQSTLVRRGATIGANATIICGHELGEYCFIGSGSVVTQSVKPYALVVGNPGRQIGWMSRYGEKLSLPLRAPAGQALYAKCPGTGEKYVLQNDTLDLCTEKEETKPEPTTLLHRL